jgi:formate C-acetyltransferase
MVENVPTPFTSALMRGCIGRGQDMLVGMDYHLPGLYERGLTNAANALAAIQQVVFEEGSLSMAELIQAMRDDFSDASIRAHLLAAPKWGNNDDKADRWAMELVAMRERVLDEIDARFGDNPHTVCHVVRSLHHLDGKRIAASPDGRFAWTPVADSIGAQTGTALAGPTTILNSVVKLDAARNYRGGYNLNLTLPKASTTPDALLPLIETFFANGGQELQVSCFDAATLRAAREDPERYGDLIVRISGFSTRFVDLSSVEQQELIDRAEAIA